MRTLAHGVLAAVIRGPRVTILQLIGAIAAIITFVVDALQTTTANRAAI